MANKITLALILLLFIPAVLATTTEINVKTLQNHRVAIFVQDSQTFSMLSSFYQDSGSSGLVTKSYTGDQSEVKIIVKLTKDGKEVLIQDFGKISTGSPKYFRVIPGNISENYKTEEDAAAAAAAKEAEEKAAAEAANATQSQNLTEETQKTSNSSLTGFSILNNSTKMFSNSTLWIVGIVIVLAIVVFIFFMMRGREPSYPSIHSHSPPSAPKVNLIKPSQSPPPTTMQHKLISPIDKELMHTQHELNDVKSRIEKIRRIKEAKAQLQQQQEELKRLQSEGL